MTSFRTLEVQFEDQNPQKWCVSLREDVFQKFLSQGGPTVHNVFGEGSLFSPMLFGKFFDPSDAFPLWEFNSDVLLSNLPGHSTVDWTQTYQDYVIRAELPGAGKDTVQVSVEHGKVVEISGLWKKQSESKTKDWRGGHWWEHGYVRRLELPEDADWSKIEADVSRDIVLVITIAKKSAACDMPEGSAAASKDSESV